MWLLRRASFSLRPHGLCYRACSVHHLELPITPPALEGPVRVVGSASFERFYSARHASTMHVLLRRGLSSQSGTGEEENETVDDGRVDELVLERDVVDDAEFSKFDSEILDTKVDSDEKSPSESGVTSKLFDAIVACRGSSVSSTLDKWVEEGNRLDREDISFVIDRLCKSYMYGKAFKLSMWMEESEKFEFDEVDYDRHVNLIAKLFGIESAENYFEKIPEPFRRELVHVTLLVNYVRVNNVKKAEVIFNKMRSLRFPVTLFTCNQMILLYKRNNHTKISNILELMEKEGLNPSIITYRVLLSAKGESKDITGMEQVYDLIKTEGFELDPTVLLILAKCYAFAGFKEKALAAAKKVEGDNLEENRGVCAGLLEIYGFLELAHDLRRVWKVCDANPDIRECVQAIIAWGKVNDVDEAEAVFEKMLKAVKKPSELHFSELLKLYTNHNMLSKGKELVMCMEDSGIPIGPGTLNCLVRLYVGAGDVEKAESVLEKASNNKVKPLLVSFQTVLNQYAKRGDVDNAEKIYEKIKDAGYTARCYQFQTLLEAYINAKVPTHGMRDRLRADNIFVNSILERQLAVLDSFRKTTASDMVN